MLKDLSCSYQPSYRKSDTITSMFRESLFYLLLALLFLPSAAAQQPSTHKTYEGLIERVKKNDRSVDFKESRLAYTDTNVYSPYGGDRESRKMMFEALQKRDFDKVLENSGKILASNYLDLNGHFGSFVAHRELGHAELADYHRFVFEGLVNSIRDSGDGKSEETSMVVISTDEEYVLLNYLGLRPSKQALIQGNGHHCDMMTSVDPKTNETVI